jgi:DNA-binding CsgD family transcriptional regulator
MDVLDLVQSSHGAPQPQDYIARLVDSIGQPEFGQHITAFAKDVFTANQLTAFSFRKNVAPRPIGIHCSEHGREANTAARRYIVDHWQTDPSNFFMNLQTTSRCGRYLVFMSADDALTDSFRKDCFAEAGVHFRMSLIQPFHDQFVKLSFHRPYRAGPFRREDFAALGDVTNTLCSLLMRHQKLSKTASTGVVPAAIIEARLKLRCAELTPRELSVCALIVQGMSSDGIALELGISTNTVLTFRRRAYARLCISSQNELIHLAYTRSVVPDLLFDEDPYVEFDSPRGTG